MTTLSPELAVFASIVDAQRQHVRAGFRYCLALAMVESGKVRLVETQPGMFHQFVYSGRLRVTGSVS